MWGFKQNIYKTRRIEGVVPICYSFTLSTTSASSELYTYTDCEGASQSGTIGMVGGYDAVTFCALSVDSISGGIESTLNGACPSSYYAVNVTTNGWASNSEACANYITIDLPLYSTGYGDVITVGSTILYTDPALTLPYDGGGLYRITSYGGIVSIVIEATGLVTEFGTVC